MASLEITVKKKNNRVLVEMDADRFEKIAADFGFFSEDFLKSLDRAERDLKAGKVTIVKSLKELRRD